jgi:hypothetical protein
VSCKTGHFSFSWLKFSLDSGAREGEAGFREG